jgi:hypothetical protein
MKTGRVFTLVFAVGLLVVGLSRSAHAQCGDDPSGGAIAKITCYEDSRYSVPASGSSVSSGVDGFLAFRFPVLSAVTWWVSRHPDLARTAVPARAASSSEALATVRRRFGR